MNQGGRGRSSGGGELVRLPVRWIVLFTGYKATEDYVPAASEGESPALVKEATDICVAFHPHSEIRLFPKEAMLFWRARSTNDLVITRVSTAPNPDGIRTALEYSSIVLDEESFRELRYNPFRTRDLELHEKVRAQFLERSKAALWVDVPAENLTPALSTESGSQRSTAFYGAGADKTIPGLGGDRTASMENVEKIERYCAECSITMKVPATFATWWPSGDPPADYFDVVLHSPPSRTLSLRDASDSIAALGAEITAALPRTTGDDTVVSELARSVVANIDVAQRALSDAVTRLNSETVDQFREHLSDAANAVAQVGTSLNTIVKRLDDRISRTDAARLLRLAQQSEAIGPEFAAIRHPNPFAARKPAPVAAGAARPSAAAAARGGANPNVRLYVFGAIAVAVIGGLIAILTHRAAPPPNAIRKIHAGRNGPATGIASSGVPTPSVDPAIAKVVAAQDAVMDAAKASASSAAKAAAAAHPSKPVSDAQLDQITLTAVESAYQNELDSSTYKSVFVAGKHSVTTYDSVKAQLPLLVPAVHEAAALAATQGQAAVQINNARTDAAKAVDKAKADEAAALAAKAQRTPTPEPTEKPARTREVTRHTSEETHQPRASTHHSGNSDSGSGGSKTSTNSSAPKPKTGSADQSGL